MAIDPTLYRRTFEASAGAPLDPVAMRRQRLVEAEAQQEQQYRAAQLQSEQAKMDAAARRESTLGGIGRAAAGGDGAGARRMALEAGAFDIIDKLDSMDDAQRTRTLEVTRSVAPVIASLKQVPPAMRKQAAMAVLPSRGLTPEQIDALDLSDVGIDAKIGEAMTITEYLADTRDKRDFGYNANKDARDFNYRAGNDAAQRAVQMRGQNMTDARAAATPTNRGNVPSGYRFKADGSLEAIPGGPSDGNKLTEGQAKSVGYYRQAAAAARSMNNTKGYNPSLVANALYGNDVSYTQLGQAERRILNSQLAFANGVLRLETGATINDGEIRNKARQLFALPGDGPDVLADKAAQRSEALAAMRAAAGPGVRSLPLVTAPKAQSLPSPKSAADFAKLKSGTTFIAPDGSRRVKP